MWNIDSLRACNRWLRFRYFPQFTKSIYHFCDRLLREGVEADGLTPERRAFYAAVRNRYRWWEKAWRWADITLAKWIPGRKARSTGAILNLGSGVRGWVPYVNVDIRKDVDADMVVDLAKTPWPWPDDYASEVKFERSLEHMGDGDFKTLQAMMRELYRVCQPGARVTIQAKHPMHNAFVYDPTCVQVISPISLSLFDTQTSIAADPAPVALRNKVDFEIVERTIILDEPYKSRFLAGQLTDVDAMRLSETTLNVCSEFQIHLVAHKPPRAPPPIPLAPSPAPPLPH
jgi:hypothetical protein